MIDLNDIHYLKQGSAAQQKAYQALMQTQVFEILKDFSATLVGTYPIDIAISSSDLDIICEVRDHEIFLNTLQTNFAGYNKFELSQKEIKEVFTTICRFESEGFSFEVFGQNKAVRQQWAYRHMLIEHKLLEKYGPEFKAKVISLKEKGIKTEATFAMLLQLHGDPYEVLLQLE